MKMRVVEMCHGRHRDSVVFFGAAVAGVSVGAAIKPSAGEDLPVSSRTLTLLGPGIGNTVRPQGPKGTDGIDLLGREGNAEGTWEGSPGKEARKGGRGWIVHLFLPAIDREGSSGKKAVLSFHQTSKTMAKRGHRDETTRRRGNCHGKRITTADAVCCPGRHHSSLASLADAVYL